MSITCSADALHEAVNDGNVDKVMDFLKRGVNVNALTSSGRSHLGRAAQLGNVAIVCLLLDADKFYSTPEEESLGPSDTFFTSGPNGQGNIDEVPYPKNSFKAYKDVSHKCCSPSIDSETCTCSDEMWSQEASDSNTGQQSDLELGSNSRESTFSQCAQIPIRQNSPTDKLELVNEPSISASSSNAFCSSSVAYSPLNSYSGSQFPTGYCMYEYREEEEEEKEDTEESSCPVVSSTEDSDSAHLDQRPPLPHPHPHRHSSVFLHRTLGRGRANIVSSDSEFETENYHRRRQNKHNHHHRSNKHERDNGRSKVFLPGAYSSNSFFAQLHKEYINLGLSSPWMLRRSCDLNQRDAYGRSALHYATEQGHVYVGRLLIKAGAKVDAIDAEHMTALHLAAQRGFTEIVNLLIEGGAKVNNKMNDKSSPLHIAASRGYTDIVEVLLDKGAKIDSLDSSDRTPLMLAVSRAHYKVAQLLIKRGAKVNIEEIHGYTPLCEAVWQKEVKLVQMLLKAKAKITQSHFLLHYAVLHRHYQLAEILLAARCIVNLRDDKGDTPLIIAARTCQPVIIKLLLRHGANANYPNGLTGAKPLHEAVEGTRDAQFDDFLVVFKLLRAHGARLDVYTLTEGDTPLYRALLLEKNKAAAILIREGCDVNTKPPGKFADYLSIAASRGNFSLSCLLILAGFQISKVTWLVSNQQQPSDGNQQSGSGNQQPSGGGNQQQSNDGNQQSGGGNQQSGSSIISHLLKIKSRPLSLADQTRIFIRSTMKENAVNKITNSELPTKVKRFLLLKDLNGVDI